MHWMRNAVLLLILTVMVWPLRAQQTVDAQPLLWDVYIQRGVDERGADQLLFINLLTGDVRPVLVTGERYTLLRDQVLYFDWALNAVMTLQPDGTVSAHPFIRLEDGTRRVDWVVSPDQRLLAWTVTSGTPEALSTITSIASADGSNQRVVLRDGPRDDGARALPVAIARDNTLLLLDSQPNAIGDLVPYRQYASLFGLSLVDGTITAMPGEPDCFCAAAISAGQFVRLSVTENFGGFDVRVYDLDTGSSRRIAAARLINYTQGGDILISPDGTKAVYALTQAELGAESNIRTVMMLVDLQTATQRQVTEPLNAYLNPVLWTEDNTAVLFTLPDRDGTWKFDLTDGTVQRVASASYLGLLEN